ncbi:MAG: glycosyltransferase family 4 protein [Methyloprofundus sp.]|nr:glycosyltransferase family 4 protein [Methyloprofundus sp.]
MHIGIISSEYPPDIGGVETYAAEFAKALLILGHQVSVFVHKNHPIDTQLNSGIKIYSVLEFTRQLDRHYLMGVEVDAWHVMNAAHSWLTLETDKPVVVSIHGNDFLNPYPLSAKLTLSNYAALWRIAKYTIPFEQWLGRKLTKTMLHKALPKAHVILSNSAYTETVFLQEFPECKGKTLVAQVGVGESFLSPPLVNKNNKVIQLLTVSRLSEPRKNVDRVLHALATLASEFEFHYSVIGDGFYKPELETLTKQLGLSDRVTFSGRLTMEQVIKKMAQADLFILPSSTLADSHEGFGIVYLEAAACGTPSLATHQAGAIEAVEKGQSGFFVNDPSIENIQHALKTFLAHEIAFDQQACRDFASRFTWQKVVAHALPFYSSHMSNEK